MELTAALKDEAPEESEKVRKYGDKVGQEFPAVDIAPKANIAPK
jgi:hypothetical protein